MRKIYCLLIALSGLVLAARAQLSITGEIRPRSEFRNGFKKPTNGNTKPALFIEQRSRVYFNYFAEKVAFNITLQDVRLWGNTAQIYKTDPSLINVYEAWGQYNFTPQLALKVGRQELEYDNARFLGDLSWAQQGRSHDLAKFIYKKENTSFHLGAAFNQEDVLSKPEPARLSGTFYGNTGNYKTMQFAWFNKKFDTGTFSLLFFNNGMQNPLDSAVYFSQTAGFFGNKKINKVKIEGELYYQSGKNPAGKELNAFFGSASATLTTGPVPLTIGFDYLSGTSAGSEQDNSFNPLYGTNHKFYGFMDYFYVGNQHGAGGLTDIFLKASHKISEKLILSADLHQFYSSAEVLMADNTRMSSTLGTEADLVFKYTFSPEVNLIGGYSQLFASDTMEFLKGGDKTATNNWAWVMLTIKPVLFSSIKG